MKLLNILPREDKFYRLLESQVLLAYQCTQELRILLNKQENGRRTKAHALIAEAKGKAKEATNTMMLEICRTFVTPFDREDLQAFALQLYGIPKSIDKIQQRVSLRPLLEVPFEAPVALIEKQAEAMKSLVFGLSQGNKMARVSELAQQIHEWEHEGDVLLVTCLKQIFEADLDHRDVLLGKEIYDLLDRVMDSYSHAAHVAFQIVLKHS
jgi:uncharacterized protein Yka (UPF0111/DUF47 family)